LGQSQEGLPNPGANCRKAYHKRSCTLKNGERRPEGVGFGWARERPWIVIDGGQRPNQGKSARLIDWKCNADKKGYAVKGEVSPGGVAPHTLVNISRRKKTPRNGVSNKPQGFFGQGESVPEKELRGPRHVRSVKPCQFLGIGRKRKW